MPRPIRIEYENVRYHVGCILGFPNIYSFYKSTGQNTFRDASLITVK